MKKYTLNYENFGFILKLNKIKPAGLAEKMGVKRQTIYHWKKHGTSLENIKIMAHYLGVDIEELIEGEII